MELAKQPPKFYDVIYIDADHGLSGVQRDVDAALKTIKDDGILVFNDYVFFDKNATPYGVIYAANDLCVNHGWRMRYLALHNMMFCDIALERGS